MPGDRRRQGWDPFDNQWGHGRGPGRGSRRRARWPDGKVPPEVAAERFAEAVEQVANKVGSALERAFEETGDRVDRQKVQEVGARVASAIETAIGKVGEAIPGAGPDAKLERRDRRLLKQRDGANTQMILFMALWVGISMVVALNEGIADALTPMIVLGAVFGALVARAAVWKASHRQAIDRAVTRMTQRELGEQPTGVASQDGHDAAEHDDEQDAGDEADGGDESEARLAAAAEAEALIPGAPVHGFKIHEPTVDGPLCAVEQEGLQVLELLREMGEERPDIHRSVETTVAKTRELTTRRERLEAMLADPDLAGLDGRIEELQRRIDGTADEQTRSIYIDTLAQLRAQSDSLADVRLMIARLDAYTNASLQSLRTIHIDLLRLQTGDMSDPAQAIREVSARAGSLGMEIKSVREVVEEVDRSRRARVQAQARKI